MARNNWYDNWMTGSNQGADNYNHNRNNFADSFSNFYGIGNKQRPNVAGSVPDPNAPVGSNRPRADHRWVKRWQDYKHDGGNHRDNRDHGGAFSGEHSGILDRQNNGQNVGAKIDGSAPAGTSEGSIAPSAKIGGAVGASTIRSANSLNSGADDAMREAYQNYQITNMNSKELMNYLGIGGSGQAESSIIGAGNAYQNAVGEIQSGRTQGLMDLQLSLLQAVSEGEINEKDLDGLFQRLAPDYQATAQAQGGYDAPKREKYWWQDSRRWDNRGRDNKWRR